MRTSIARRPVFLTISSLVAVIGVSMIAGFGPLDPPTGPIASTAKPLSEVEPRIAISAANTPGDNDATPSIYKITQPGSYYLTGNINATSNKTGIEIDASGVTLDLNGFEVVGVIDGGGGGSMDGVGAYTLGRSNIAVLNGTVRNWAKSGITIAGTDGCRVERVRASGNSLGGIMVPATSIVTDCTVVGGGTGIRTGRGGLVMNCTVTGSSLYGIFADSASTVKDCRAHGNTGTGILANEGSSVSNCVAFLSGAKGIWLLNGTGTVVGCTVEVCTGDGIASSSSSTIRDNLVIGAGQGGDGAAIYITGGDNRIEGNNCTSSDRGIHVANNGNVIVRNTCSGNTLDWVFAANNVFGPIIDRRAPASAAVSGFSAPSSLGSTDPNANFSY